MEISFGFTAVVIIIIVLYLISSIKILAEYERGVIFRLGRLPNFSQGPGVAFGFSARSIVWCGSRCVRKRLKFRRRHHHARQCYAQGECSHFLACDRSNKAVVEVSNYVYQTSQFAQTTLRSVLASRNSMNCLLTAKRSTCGCKAFSTSTLRPGA